MPEESFMHSYIGIERLNLTDAQTLTLLNALKSLAPNLDKPRPCYRNHWRVRLDQNALIMEALFNVNEVSVNAVRQYLADVFGIAVSNITVQSTTQTVYGPVVTLRQGGQNRIRMIQFGGVSPTWEESRTAAVLYLKDNQAAWEPPI